MSSADPLSVLSEPTLPVALRTLKAQVALDLAEFRREVAWRLPAALASVSASEVRQHLGAFLEQTFRSWAERENHEVQRALAGVAGSPRAQSTRRDAELLEPASGPDSRLLRPTFDVSTFAVDASVVAALALGVGSLFANVAVGGLLLIAAPTLATFGRERGDRALRKRAAESAMKSVDEAVAKLGAELNRTIDDCSRHIAG
jgi:hypothetical protein